MTVCYLRQVSYATMLQQYTSLVSSGKCVGIRKLNRAASDSITNISKNYSQRTDNNKNDAPQLYYQLREYNCCNNVSVATSTQQRQRNKFSPTTPAQQCQRNNVSVTTSAQQRQRKNARTSHFSKGMLEVLKY